MNWTVGDGTNRQNFVGFRFYRRTAVVRVRRMSRNRIGYETGQNQYQNHQYFQELSHYYPKF